MKNPKKIILVMVLSMMSGTVRPEESGQAQSGVMVSSRVLMGGAAVATVVATGTVLYLKRRIDRAARLAEIRESEMRKHQMEDIRSKVYTFACTIGYLGGFFSVFEFSGRLFSHFLYKYLGFSEVCPHEVDNRKLQTSIDHARLTEFSSQISPGWLGTSEYDPNAVIDGDPVLHRIVKKWGEDPKERLRWMKCLGKNRSVQWDTADKEGFTALQYAVILPDTDLVRMLCRHGARPDKGVVGGDFDGCTALHYVASIEDSKTRMAIASELLGSPKIDLEVRTVNRKRTPLAMAAFFGCSDLVRLYLDHGASHEAIDEDGNTVLFLAVHSGDRASVMTMLSCDNGHAINRKNEAGDTPLCRAIRDKRYAIIEDLLSNAHVDLHVSGKNGKEPVQLLYDNADTISLDIAKKVDRVMQLM